jgi:predicted lipid-binding transport protein (Tim44 family)
MAQGATSDEHLLASLTHAPAGMTASNQNIPVARPAPIHVSTQAAAAGDDPMPPTNAKSVNRRKAAYEAICTGTIHQA